MGRCFLYKQRLSGMTLFLLHSCRITKNLAFQAEHDGTQLDLIGSARVGLNSWFGSSSDPNILLGGGGNSCEMKHYKIISNFGLSFDLGSEKVILLKLS